VWSARVFFKQWGGQNKKRAGRVLRGRTWDAMLAQVEAAAP
jgi:protein gp37